MLGFSVYPEHSTTKEIIKYIDLCNSLGYKMMFTCLLSVNKPKEEIKDEFKAVISHATNLGIEVTLDVSPRVFEQLNISYNDLSFFKELNASAIRLDESYNGKQEADMTYNPQDLKIVVNMSQDVPYINNIIEYAPNKFNLVGCHNFYPQRYCGLEVDYFISSSKRFKDLNIRTGAFISSKTATIGPWPVMQGLPTIELHRDLNITTQVKHLYMLDLLDDIIISNMFASEEELKAVASLTKYIPEFKISINENSDIENKIIFEEDHFYRGDVCGNLIRSTQSRVKYKGEDFKSHNTSNIIKKGSIVIGNNEFGQYAGELQIVLKDIIDEDLQRNVVGHIVEEELFLLDLLKPWSRFKFTQN